MIFKSSISSFIVSLVSIQVLIGCGNTGSNPNLLNANIISPIQAQSFGGVYNEIEMGIHQAFGELDENQDGAISPAEFGVDSPKKLITFREGDLNRDGKITLIEMMPDELKKLSMAQKMKMTASSIFNSLDKAPKDNKLSHGELNSAVVSKLFEDFFLDYDTEKNTKGYLSISEFQNLFAYIASSDFPNDMGVSDVINVTPQPQKPITPVKTKIPVKKKPVVK